MTKSGLTNGNLKSVITFNSSPFFSLPKSNELHVIIKKKWKFNLTKKIISSLQFWRGRLQKRTFQIYIICSRLVVWLSSKCKQVFKHLIHKLFGLNKLRGIQSSDTHWRPFFKKKAKTKSASFKIKVWEWIVI